MQATGLETLMFLINASESTVVQVRPQQLDYWGHAHYDYIANCFLILIPTKSGIWELSILEEIYMELVLLILVAEVYLLMTVQFGGRMQLTIVGALILWKKLIVTAKKVPWVSMALYYNT